MCSRNLLENLEGSPEYIQGFLDCSFNKLKNLKGVPKYIGKNLIAYCNRLESLEYLPEIVDGKIFINSNEKLGDKQLLDNLSAIRHSLFYKEINSTNQFNKIIRRKL